mgnify:FL=1|jgi:hypothetical protein|tara:strand:+ start:124 stop:528 length:405 start_codon:yes stop_codon:yes gene_type:complete
MATKVSKKTNEKMWKRIVASVKSGSAGGRPGQWSARKAQIATKRYKKAGGGYKGAKSSSNSLSKWSKQKWDYVSKGDKKKPRKKRGRYLPESVRKSLSPSQKAATNRKKRAASKAGKQKAKYSKSVARKVRNAK